MGRSVGKVSFFESFHGRLRFEGRACVNGLSVQGRFHCHSGTSQWPSPLPRVNSVRRHRSFLCHSHVRHHATHSANEHHGTHRGLRPRLNWAACQKQSANRSGNSTTHTPSSCLAVRLARPAHQSLPCTLMLGYTGLNCQQSKPQGKVEAMQSSSISAGFKVKAFSRSVASRTGLTVGSTRTPILRIAPDRPYGRRLTWR
jgi:hypothetical protein